MAACLAEPFDLEGISHKASASFGLQVFQGTGAPVHELIAAADTAMYAAKKRCGQGV